MQRAAKPVLAAGAAAAAVASGVAVGRALRPRRHTLDLQAVGWRNLDVVLPKLPDMNSVAKGVSKAGEQVGRTGGQLRRIAGDIQKAGETTERIGKLLAK